MYMLLVINSQRNLWTVCLKQGPEILSGVNDSSVLNYIISHGAVLLSKTLNMSMAFFCSATSLFPFRNSF